MSTAKAIDGEMTINDVIREHPATVAVFHELGLDACCGGGLSIRVAAGRHGLDPDAVVRMLNTHQRRAVPAG